MYTEDASNIRLKHQQGFHGTAEAIITHLYDPEVKKALTRWHGEKNAIRNNKRDYDYLNEHPEKTSPLLTAQVVTCAYLHDLAINNAKRAEYEAQERGLLPYYRPCIERGRLESAPAAVSAPTAAAAPTSASAAATAPTSASAAETLKKLNKTALRAGVPRRSSTSPQPKSKRTMAPQHTMESGGTVAPPNTRTGTEPRVGIVASAGKGTVPRAGKGIPPRAGKGILPSHVNASKATMVR